MAENIFEKFLELNRPKSTKSPESPLPMTQTTPTAPIKKEKPSRTVGDVNIMAEAQRMYNPNLPPTKPKGPTEAQTQLGTTANSGVEGRWGTVGEE